MTAMKDQELDASCLTRITRAMLSVAAIDGIQAAEAALISQFYEASRDDSMPPAHVLIASAGTAGFDPRELAGSSADFADTVVKCCLMAAYADGRLSDAERKQVKLIADAAGVGSARLAELLAEVRDDLVGALAHLPDAGSVASVVRELDVAD